MNEHNRHPNLESTGGYADLKEWDPIFLTPRQHTGRLFLPCLQQYDSRSSEIELLLHANFRDRIPSWAIQEVKNFCRDSTPLFVMGHEMHARGKIYDIEIPSGLPRKHQVWLSATEMEAILMEPVRIGLFSS